MTNELSFMMERFPFHQIKIIELYGRDGDFRQLCNDFYQSVKTAEAMRKPDQYISHALKDYEELSEALEEELLNVFKKWNYK